MDEAEEYVVYVLQSDNLDDSGKGGVLAVIANTLESVFQSSRSLQDLARAIAIYEQAFAIMPNNNPLRLTILKSIGNILQKRFDLTGSMEDLNRSIALYEQGLVSLPHDSPSISSYYDSLSVALFSRFDQTGSMEDIDRAIITAQQAVELAADDDADSIPYLSSLACALMGRFRSTGSVDDLQGSITTNELDVSLVPDEGHLKCWSIFTNLGAGLLARFKRTGSMEDLRRAIVLNELTVSQAPQDDPDSAIFMYNLSLALETRFDRTGASEDLARAIAMNEQALELTSTVNPSHPLYLNNLGTLLLSRFKGTGLLIDLDRAITAHEQAAEQTSPNNPLHLSMCLNNLSNALHSRFVHIGSANDLDRAIATSKRALAIIPTDHSSHSTIVKNLGALLTARFDRSGSIDDLNCAVAMVGQAITSNRDDEVSLVSCFDTLGGALERQFDRIGLITDLDQAIEMKDRVVKSTPIDHPRYPTRLSNLSVALIKRFQHSGSINDLDRAIVASEQAVMSNPNDPACLINLALAYNSRYEWTESTSDLDHAISVSEKSLAELPPYYAERGAVLNSLGCLLQRRFDWGNSASDIEKAIPLHEEAVASTATDHINHAMYVSNLGLAFQNRFEKTGSVDDLDNAITMKEKAVALAADHSRVGMYLNNLANSLLSRFERTESISVLDRAIETYKRAVASKPNDALFLHNLGDALQLRFEKTGSANDFALAIEMNERASLLPTATPFVQIRAAKSASDLLIGRDNNRAKDLLERAVTQLPTISPRTLSQRDKQHNLSQFANITSTAVSVYLECGEDPAKAVQLLEFGRGIIASLQLGLRSDITALAATNAELAQQFSRLRDQLDRVPNNGETTNYVTDSAHRHELSKQFNSLVGNIRQLPGFERFLLGPSESEMKNLARYPIVLFNVSEIRVDAFIIDQERIRLLRLPSLKYSDLRDNVLRFFKTIHSVNTKTYATALLEVNKVLEWLWDVAVGPILDELGFKQPPSHSDVWPRVCWISSGILTLLPIHAAGYHDSTQNAMDRVISSYSATVRSLAYAREQVGRTKEVDSLKVMLLSMPKTLRQTDLPYAEKEVQELIRLMDLSANVSLTTIQHPTRQAVMSAIRDHQVVHFACHGHSASDPSQSRLLLCDWETAPLTVSDIASLNLQVPQLAYLSACHTATTVAFRLLDESINLSTAIQLAGYPSVVGTLWHVADQSSVDVARDVYEWMLAEDTKLDTSKSAEALHRAVRALREKTRTEVGFSKKVASNPFIWAPFIHLGV